MFRYCIASWLRSVFTYWGFRGRLVVWYLCNPQIRPVQPTAQVSDLVCNNYQAEPRLESGVFLIQGEVLTVTYAAWNREIERSTRSTLTKCRISIVANYTAPVMRGAQFDSVIRLHTSSAPTDRQRSLIWDSVAPDKRAGKRDRHIPL